MGVGFCFQRSSRIGASASVTCSGEKKTCSLKREPSFRNGMVVMELTADAWNELFRLGGFWVFEAW